MNGLVLFAHGARDPRWAAPFEALALRLATRCPTLPVRLAYLELMAPTLDEAAAALVQRGCTQVTVLPMFLGAGGHVRRDLPEQLARLQVAHPTTTFTASEVLGEMPEMLDAMASAIAVRFDEPRPPAER